MKENNAHIKDVIKELSRNIQEAEIDVQNYINNRLLKLKEETGLSPKEVTVFMLDVTNQDSFVREYTSGYVKFHIDIDSFH